MKRISYASRRQSALDGARYSLLSSALCVLPFFVVLSGTRAFVPLSSRHSNPQQQIKLQQSGFFSPLHSQRLLWTRRPAPPLPQRSDTMVRHAQPQSTTALETSFQVSKQAVGSGSYGTVHLLQSSHGDWCIGKRAWTASDLQTLQPEAHADEIAERAKRCRTYWETEVHCLQKLSTSQSTVGLPRLLTTWKEEEEEGETHEWMVFELIPAANLGFDNDKQSNQQPLEEPPKPAMSLHDIMELDLEDHHKIEENHLFLLARAVGVDVPENSQDEAESIASMAETLDKVLDGLLEVLAVIHANGIVHRDVKPANLLISHQGRIHLIDFGSAADLDTVGPLRKNIGLSETVAVSPVYAAPEIFVDASIRQSALNFDCFSVALLICQLLFQYLDERTDAGFHQQLQAVDWQLNTWLATELAGKVRPAGIDAALQVLSIRLGLWTLLQDMLRKDAWARVDSQTALQRWRQIVQQSQSTLPEDLGVVESSVIAAADGPFLADVLESMEYCRVPENYQPQNTLSFQIRPLQFVATFKRTTSLGLLLSEFDGVDLETDFEDDASRQQWQRATSEAIPGEVYVTGVVPEGQAEDLGIFEIGDRVQGVGELPLAEQGFEKFVQLLQDESTPNPNYITLHFDRKRYAAVATSNDEGESQVEQNGLITPSPDSSLDSSTSSLFLLEKPIEVKDQGAWTSKGKRKSQEDRFLLHELHDTKDRSIVLAGVLDGHLGTAASSSVQQEFPTLMMQELLYAPETAGTSEKEEIETILESAWEKACDSYRSQCDMDTDGNCRVADYDAREGALDANTGSKDVVAGTTANIVALDKQTGRLAILNCGDSRSFVLMGSKKIVFESADHKPDRELDRFLHAQETNPACLYKTPQCRFSRWYVPVGDYEYAVSRSLEGPFATERGIVSDADIQILQGEPESTVLVATDGLWEVMDTREVAKIVAKMRFDQGLSASDSAKTLCSMAIQRGSSDNVSVVILFLD